MDANTPPKNNSSSENTSTCASAGSSPEGVVLPVPQSVGLPGGDSNFRPAPVMPTPPLALTAAPSTANEEELPEIGPPLDENEHKYVGLVNQAMTCYLNSLVQTLYMTPEFRNAIYKWEYKSQTGKGTGESSIPCQIQKLFLLLQTTDRDAMETTDLTASFGWSSSEAYDQHDVQELCRLMFDALEHRWKGSKHDKLIQDLYRGTMQDFVKCLTCGRENVRQDYFLDLPLALKPFGAIEAYKSVEEALHAFVTPERLDGSNQYHCESCQSKQDADKGLRVTQFPYLLTIQLKRFDFDYNTMHRIKLNDKMTFPDILNLNPYLYAPNAPAKEEGANELYCEGPVVGLQVDKEEVQRLLRQGPYVYELFSVMVHQGSAAGGHYYAYIKNLDQDRWYCFNDSRVDYAQPMEIEKSYGGSYGGWSNSNTNAYMLMYRQVDSDRNQKFVRTVDLPKHIVQLQNHWRKLEEEKERQRLYQQSLVYVTVDLNYPCDSETLANEKFKMETPRSTPVGEVFNAAFKFFEEKGRANGIALTRSKSRLVRHVPDGRMFAEYVSKNDMVTKLENCFLRAEANHTKELLFLLDVQKCSRFLLSPERPRTIAVSRVDIANRTVWPPFRVNLNPEHDKVLLVKKLIGSIFGDPQRETVASRLVLQLGDNTSRNFQLLSEVAAPIGYALAESYANIPLLFYDGGAVGAELEEDRRREPENSLLFEILDRKKFAMILRLKLPDQHEISHTAMLCNAFAGPSWRDTVVQESDSGDQPTVTEASPGSEVKERLDAVAEVLDNSERSSPVSDDMVLGTDSFCNNTPQVSPTVSDPDEGYADERSLGQNQRSQGCWNLEHIDPARFNTAAGSSSEIYYDQEMATDTATASIADTASTIMAPPEGNAIVTISTNIHGLNTYDVDSRITIGSLKIWLSELLSLDPAMFVLSVHHSDDLHDRGYESSAKDEDQVGSCFGNCNWLEVKLRPPLRPNEKLIKVYLFDAEETNKDNWKHLFDLAAAKTMLVGDFQLQCQRLYQEICCVELDYKQYRLRDMNSHQKSVIHPDRTFEQARGVSSWTNNVYLQVITDERVIGKPGDPVFVRRFFPSTVEIGQIHEVMVNTAAEDGCAELLHSISETTGIPLEHVEITEPPNSQWDFGKWPYAKPRLEMLDGTTRFVSKPSVNHLRFFDRIGYRVIYYKDNREISKELTEEERKQITIKDNTSSSGSAVQRRKERPLRIQMSSISEP